MEGLVAAIVALLLIGSAVMVNICIFHAEYQHHGEGDGGIGLGWMKFSGLRTSSSLVVCFGMRMVCHLSYDDVVSMYVDGSSWVRA